MSAREILFLSSSFSLSFFFRKITNVDKWKLTGRWISFLSPFLSFSLQWDVWRAVQRSWIVYISLTNNERVTSRFSLRVVDVEKETRFIFLLWITQRERRRKRKKKRRRRRKEGRAKKHSWLVDKNLISNLDTEKVSICSLEIFQRERTTCSLSLSLSFKNG